MNILIKIVSCFKIFVYLFTPQIFLRYFLKASDYVTSSAGLDGIRGNFSAVAKCTTLMKTDCTQILVPLLICWVTLNKFHELCPFFLHCKIIVTVSVIGFTTGISEWICIKYLE